MQVKIQMIIEQQNETITKEIICLNRLHLAPETLGLTLKESKLITSKIQENMVGPQIEEYIVSQRPCPCCGEVRPIKGYHSLKYRTLFGKILIQSPRLYECNCHSHKHNSFSPLARLLPERISPELNYLESEWASLMSYGMTTKLLEEVLPLKTHHSSVRHNAQQTATRLEQGLGEEQYMFISGCQNDLRKLPNPGSPLIVSIDGGYVHAREGTNRKAGWFETIVGKTIKENKVMQRFGSVVNYDSKPKRRLYEVLRDQGLQMNQQITFLSDGGDTVQDLQSYFSFNSEHILDWFHITMKLTVMQQMARGVSIDNDSLKVNEELDRIKWYLWHGNVYKALKVSDSLRFNLEVFCDQKKNNGYKLWKAADEFYGYINSNSHLIPNYGDRYRHGEAISSAIAESTVNELISKRMAKKQQMRWTKKGAHLLLQLRVKTLDKQLRLSFCKWYPQMDQEQQVPISLAA
jgi:hypothetical protein